MAERLRSPRAQDEAWYGASAVETTSLALTAAEFKVAVAEVITLIRQIGDRYADRSDPARVPQGAREIGLFFVGFVAPMHPRP